MNPVADMLSPSNLLRQVKGKPVEEQNTVSSLARYGCSAAQAQKYLQQAEYTPERAQALVAAAYPAG